MTIPHLMNCQHSDDGWCLGCVKDLYDKSESNVISFRVSYLKSLLGYLRDDYYANRDSLMKSIKDVQDKCPHQNKVQHRDPSGGSDSFYLCPICGKDDL